MGNVIVQTNGNADDNRPTCRTVTIISASVLGGIGIVAATVYLTLYYIYKDQDEGRDSASSENGELQNIMETHNILLCTPYLENEKSLNRNRELHCYIDLRDNVNMANKSYILSKPVGVDIEIFYRVIAWQRAMEHLFNCAEHLTYNAEQNSITCGLVIKQCGAICQTKSPSIDFRIIEQITRESVTFNGSMAIVNETHYYLSALSKNGVSYPHTYTLNTTDHTPVLNGCDTISLLGSIGNDNREHNIEHC